MNENKDEEIFHYEKAKQEIENLERFDKMSDEEKQKELNLFTEQRRQESIQKYGRDIYSENRTVGSKKPIKFRNVFDKIFDFYCFWRDPILVIIALIIGLGVIAAVTGIFS